VGVIPPASARFFRTFTLPNAECWGFMDTHLAQNQPQTNDEMIEEISKSRQPNPYSVPSAPSRTPPTHAGSKVFNSLSSR